MRLRAPSRLTGQMTGSSDGAQRNPCDLDERAFVALLDQSRCELEQFCVLMLGDPLGAEQTMRDVVLTAWRERPLAPASSSARMWLYRIAVRLCFEALGQRAMSSGAQDRWTGENA